MSVAARILALLLAASSWTSAEAQLKPQQQTGSHMKVKPQNVPAERAGEVYRDFARCIYESARSKSNALLANTDISNVDLQAARITDVNTELNLERCLSAQVGQDQSMLGMRIDEGLLRDILAEEAYLSSHKVAPSVSGDAAPFQFTPTANDANLAETKALAEFADCTVRENPAGSDALLRTARASDAETAAAAALAPTLGACLFTGQKVSLTPRNIRTFIGYAMWARFRP